MSAVATSREVRAHELRAHGATYREIACELDVGVTTVLRILVPGYAERARQQSREAKRRRTGACSECGGTTRYNGTSGQGVSTLCAHCGSVKGGDTMRERTRGLGPLQLPTIEFLSEPRRFTEIRDHLGITDGHTSVHLNRMVRYGLIVRISHGVYATAESRAREPEAASPTGRADG